MSTKKRDDFSYATKRELYSWSDGRCMICAQGISGLKQGEAAHIIPASGNGPRCEFREGKDEAFIKSSKNGLLLCSTCHNLIDETNTYSYQELLDVNEMFRTRFDLVSEFNRDIYFEQDTLIKLTEAIESSFGIDNIEVPQDFAKISLEEKNEKNKLSKSKATQIQGTYNFDFPVIYNALNDTSMELITQRLVNALKQLYIKLKDTKKYSGNELLDEIIKVLKKSSKNESINVNAITYYYYIICEILEK